MIGPLQGDLLRLMETGRGTTASELHKALIRKFGEKSKSYSTVLSVLRNLAKRRPDLLSSEKVKQQLVFTLRIPLNVVHAAEFSAFVNSMGWDGKSLGFLRAVSTMPSISTAMQAAITKELAETKA
jgi:hypothetical protein